MSSVIKEQVLLALRSLLADYFGIGLNEVEASDDVETMFDGQVDAFRQVVEPKFEPIKHIQIEPLDTLAKLAEKLVARSSETSHAQL